MSSFMRALQDMFPLAKTIVKGARLRDECRGAHYKPEFALPDINATDPAERHRQADAWCRRFEENNRKWLKTTVAALAPDGEPTLTYEDVDTRLIKPRPRLYGLIGGEAIEQAWKQRQRASLTDQDRQQRAAAMTNAIPTDDIQPGTKFRVPHSAAGRAPARKAIGSGSSWLSSPT